MLDGDGLYHFTNSPALAEVRNNVWWVTNAANGNGTYLFTGAEYTNTVENPLLGGVSYTNDAGLNPRPQTGSPVYEDVRAGAPVAVGYRGAFFTHPEKDWRVRTQTKCRGSSTDCQSHRLPIPGDQHALLPFKRALPVTVTILRSPGRAPRRHPTRGGGPPGLLE